MILSSLEDLGYVPWICAVAQSSAAPSFGLKPGEEMSEAEVLQRQVRHGSFRPRKKTGRFDTWHCDCVCEVFGYLRGAMEIAFSVGQLSRPQPACRLQTSQGHLMVCDLTHQEGSSIFLDNADYHGQELKAVKVNQPRVDL